MSDPAHLERMGRELKCPICLSLLNSAVSLPCNHVFCNSCAEKSMKSALSCPVCKMPYRRREVRPAPHMDNLVSIYRSMEVASGINIFVTQNAPSAKLSEREKEEMEVDDNSAGICKVAKRGRKAVVKQSQKISTSQSNSDSVSLKPSFRTNKRVQPPQCPMSEATAYFQGKLDGSPNKEPLSLEKDAPNEKAEIVLSPFFWLRDDDVENSSQQTDEDDLTDISMPNVTFSDIKDSDDENSPRLSAEEAQCKSQKVAALFDSEMFEWTQRPCSPELCSSPVKLQVSSIDPTQGKEPAASQHVETIELQKQESADARYGSKKVRSKGSNRRTSRARVRVLQDCSNTRWDSAPENCVHPGKVSDSFEECHASGSLLNKKRTSKRTEKNHSGITPSKPAIKDAPVPVEAETKMGTEIPTPLAKEGSEEEISNISASKWIECPTRAKKQKLNSLKNQMHVEPSVQQKENTKHTLPIPHSFSVKADNKAARELTRLSKSCSRKPGRERSKFSSNGTIRSPSLNNVVGKHASAQAKNAESIQGSSDLDSTSAAERLAALDKEFVLRRCESISNKVACAFCQSSEETNASGEIIHYYNGKPVALGSNGGSKLIHSHRSCTEWAPNVYFEDDIAINLEAEVSRSRRIKCSCCGIKGAALGCYEKSCRKSFHVACAKLMPECRWDIENFVMLCPLHIGSKLPIENSESHQKRKKCYPKRQSCCKHVQAAPLNLGVDTSRNCSSLKSSKKLVVCCSSLTIAERETVAEFERLSGAVVLKSWDASVTHVIASTDENGACKRTLKVLMGILEGKWILNIGWIKSCLQLMEVVNEEQYEITLDVHGIMDGPRLGRLRVLQKEPRIFDGFEFFLAGDFEPSYKKYLQDLVIAAGGSILQRKPVSRNENPLLCGSSSSRTFIIYSLELPNRCDPSKSQIILNRRQECAETLAKSTGADVASTSWVLNSIAACKLQSC